ncbi:MAG: hypothetical protein K6F68_00650 [Clostridiales bacterium]|nr:hypothetical protein [Clostridiales bacterium]
MKDSHRISVRFDLSDPKQRKVYEALHEIDRAEHGSMSAFAIKAIGEYLDRLSYNGRFDFTLDDIRALFREEIRELDIAPREVEPSFTPPAEMTEEQRRENDRNVLKTLDMFT